MAAPIKRVVSTSFWTDGKVDEFSPEDKYFMLYLLTSPFSTQLGIYEISIKQVAFQLGYSMDTINVLLDRFENKYKMIRFSKGTNEVAILNFLRHSIMKGGAPVRDCLVKEIKAVKNKDLIREVFSRVKGYDNLNETVKGVIAEYEEKNGVLHYCNENDNENENDRTMDVSSNDTPTIRGNTSKPVRHKYGEYGKVLLTDDDLDKLKAEFPDWKERIERLDSYIAQSGKSYKNHLATIRNWARRDKAEAKTKQGGQEYDDDDLDFIPN